MNKTLNGAIKVFALVFSTVLVFIIISAGLVHAANITWSVIPYGWGINFPATTSVGDKAFFAGGNVSNYLSNYVSIYNSSTGSMSGGYFLSLPRTDIAATSVGSKSLFVGGYYSYSFPYNTTRVDIYDDSTGAWNTAELTLGRRGIAATTVGTKALFAGGGDSNNIATTIVDVYDDSTATWSTMNLTEAFLSPVATSVGNKAFITDGGKVDIYDDSNGSWGSIYLPHPRQQVAAASVGSKVFFAGGRYSDDYGIHDSNVVDIFDTSTSTWSSTNLFCSRYNIKTATVGSLVFFSTGFGGSDCGGVIIDIYDDSTETWSTYRPQGYHNSVVAVGNKAIFGGGAYDYVVEIAEVLSNLPPTANAGLDLMGIEGQQVTFDGLGSTDPDGITDIMNYTWYFGDGSTGGGATTNHTYLDNGTYTATLTITDTVNQTSTDTVQVIVNNVAPVIGSLSPIASVLPGVSVNTNANFTDVGILDTHSGSFDWGDGLVTQGVVGESNGSGTVVGSHTYATPGTYQIVLTISDGVDISSTLTSVLILTPAQATQNLIDLVETFNLQQGIENSLDIKLDNAISALTDLNLNNDQAAASLLQAFINTVYAQSDNQITITQADQLILLAQQILNSL